MIRSRGMIPPFSPVLLAGLATRSLPPQLFQPLLHAMMAAIRRRHADLFQRLSGLNAPAVLVDPVDLPLVFVLRLDPQAPALKVLRDPGEERVTAAVRGPMTTLIGLLEGRIDGDALFFSRDLVIEGDTEAIVALRNALDGAEIDVIADMASVFGPVSGAAERLGRHGRRLIETAIQDFEVLRAALLAPAFKRIEAQTVKLAKLEEKVVAAGRTVRGTAPQRSRVNTP